MGTVEEAALANRGLNIEVRCSVGMRDGIYPEVLPNNSDLMQDFQDIEIEGKIVTIMG